MTANASVLAATCLAARDLQSPVAIDEVVDGVLAHLRATVVDAHRDGRSRAGSVAYESQPSESLSVARGACGIAHVFVHTGRSLPPSFVEWIRIRAQDSDCPPGLMTGLAGIAWTLSELGVEREARRLLSRALAQAAQLDAVGLHDGLSGIGLAAIWMARRTGERCFLDAAREIGDRLSRNARHREAGVCWLDAAGVAPLECADGASGVAAFLLYLYLASGEWRWLNMGRRALDFDLLRWRASVHGDLRARERDPRGSTPSDWRCGTAGMAAVLTRYFALLGLEPHRAALSALIDRSASCGVASPGYSCGLAGIGQFLLDAAILCRTSRAERLARAIAVSLAAAAIRTSDGHRFAGESSTDADVGVAAGAGGIALFLHRFQTRQTSSFMIDELLAPEHLQAL